MAQLSHLDFLAAVERNYPQAVSAIAADDFHFDHWSRDILHVNPAPTWLAQHIEFVLETWAQFPKMRGKTLHVDLVDERMGAGTVPVLLDLPQGIVAERCKDGHYRLVLPFETTTITSDRQALAVHADLKRALAQLETQIHARRLVLQKQSDFRSFLDVDPSLAQRQLAANMLADDVVGQMTIEAISKQYRHGPRRIPYTSTACRKIIRDALQNLGISDPQNRVLDIS